MAHLAFQTKDYIMEWYTYLAAFFAGAFMANAVPHFVQGISGNKFPTPFAKPPGKGLSSPTLNVIWALGNLVVGYILLQKGKVNNDHCTALLVCFAGAAFLSILMNSQFQSKHKE